MLRDYERAWAAGDSTGLAALFTADGFVPTRTGWVRGTEAIEHAYARAALDQSRSDMRTDKTRAACD